MPPATRVRAFLLVFTALFLIALLLSIAAEFSNAKWIQTAASIGDRLESLTVIAIAATFILVEGVPMLAHWIRQAEIKAAREEGLAEGQAQGLAEGQAMGLAKGESLGLAKGESLGRALEREVWQEWRRALEAWEQRRTEAENAGQRFNEPLPKPPTDD